jgi:hypothetical protein
VDGLQRTTSDVQVGADASTVVATGVHIPPDAIGEAILRYAGFAQVEVAEHPVEITLLPEQGVSWHSESA